MGCMASHPVGQNGAAEPDAFLRDGALTECGRMVWRVYVAAVPRIAATRNGRSIGSGTALPELDALELDALMKQALRAACGAARRRAAAEGTDPDAALLDLDMNHPGVGPRGTLVMCDLVKSLAPIRGLNLAGTGMRADCVAELGRALRGHDCLLQRLDLSDNPLGERGVRALVRKFAQCPSVRELRLRNTNLDDAAASAVANHVLLSAHSVRVLDIARNALSPVGVEFMARAAACNHQLLVLDMTGCGHGSTSNGAFANGAGETGTNGAPVPAQPPPPPPHSNGAAIPVGASAKPSPALRGRSGSGGSSGELSSSTEPEPDGSPQSHGHHRSSETQQQQQQQQPQQQQAQQLASDVDELSLAQSAELASWALERNGAVAEVLESVLNAISYDRPRASATPLVAPAASPLPALPRVAVGFAETIGRRSNMEDVSLLRQGFCGVAQQHLFGVFDGHGGVECARFARRSFADTLADELLSLPASQSADGDADVHACMTRAMLRVQRMCERFRVRNGACALVALLSGTRLHVACVGDSRAMLVDPASGAGRWVSRLVLPSDAEETARIEGVGGFVKADGRVLGVIAVSRALGDVDLGDVISAEPLLSSLDLASDGWGDEEAATSRDARPVGGVRWVVLGCDGVWDKLGVAQTARMLREARDPELAAMKLRAAAFAAGSADNISVVCVRVDLTDN